LPGLRDRGKRQAAEDGSAEALVAEGKRQEERMKTGLPLRARRGRYLKRMNWYGAKLETKIGKIRLKNPIMAASGTFGHAKEFEKFMDLKSWAAL